MAKSSKTHCRYCFVWCTTFVAVTAVTLGAFGMADDKELVRPKASPQEMSDAIDNVLTLKSDSYQMFLREASMLVPPLFKGQEWADVQNLMQKRGFKVIEEQKNGDAIRSCYLAKENAIVLPGGSTFDLQLQLSAPNLNRARTPANPGKLFAADVVLVSNIVASYSQAIQGAHYPRGSVFDVVLRCDEVKEVGKEWPILNTMSIHYGYLHNRWIEYSPSGFHASVEFVASTKEEIAGNRLYFFVPSGLDPLRSLDGVKEDLDPFKPQDTIDSIECRGANEWWHGDPRTIESNKRKYLVKTQ
jgi:hypothetical protein